jgi:hypothetical protein
MGEPVLAPSGGTAPPQPMLTVAVPAYNRRESARRAIRSVVESAVGYERWIEIVVTDDSTDDGVGAGVSEELGSWSGCWRYVRNQPPLGMVGNFNSCVTLAAGRYVLILHDDDFLLPGAIGAVLGAIERAGGASHVFLFGVHVVGPQGALIREQAFEREESLPPVTALRHLLTHSSFVRFPALVASRTAYAGAGPFDPSIGNPADFDMWVRLFSHHGVRIVPGAVAAYTVHQEALTSGMFNPETVAVLLRIFDRAVALAVLPEGEVRRLQADWIHQFILAGAVRRLRAADPAGARAVLQLFRLPAVRALGSSGRWMVARPLISLLSHTPAGLAVRGTAAASRLLVPRASRRASLAAGADAELPDVAREEPVAGELPRSG